MPAGPDAKLLHLLGNTKYLFYEIIIYTATCCQNTNTVGVLQLDRPTHSLTPIIEIVNTTIA